METDHLIYGSYTDLEYANAMAVTLKKNGIECSLLDNSPGMDITMTGANDFQREVQLRIQRKDLDRVKLVLNELAKKEMEHLKEDYHLFGFANEELYEVLLESDAWNAIDVQLARKILQDRGKIVDDDLLEGLRKTRINQLKEPKKFPVGLIVLGYISSFFGGLIGIGIGIYLMNHFTTLPDGSRVPAFEESDRQQGWNIIAFGIVSILFWTYLFW